MTKQMDTTNMTAADLTALAMDLTQQAREKVAAEKEAQRVAARALEAEKAKTHYDNLLTEVGAPLAGLNEKQHAAVYAMAWEYGHSSGYDEVTGYYSDLAEMVRKIIADA